MHNYVLSLDIEIDFFHMILWKQSKTWASYGQNLRYACSSDEGNCSQLHEICEIV